MDFYGLSSLVGTVMGLSIFLIPVIGLTARYVLKPFQGSLDRFLEAQHKGEMVRILEQRLELLEQQVEAIEANQARLADGADFHFRLRSGQSSSSQGVKGSAR